MIQKKTLRVILLCVTTALVVVGYLVYKQKTKFSVILQLVPSTNDVVPFHEAGVTVQENKPSKNQPSVDQIEISDWKTYRNTEYKFEIHYPARWQKEEKTTHPSLEGVTFSDGYVVNGSRVRVTYTRFSISILKLSSEMTKAWKDDRSPSSEKLVYIGGIQAVVTEKKEDIEGQMFESSKHYQFVKDDTLFNISASVFNPELHMNRENLNDGHVSLNWLESFSLYENLFDRMIASFRFI